MPKRPRPQPLGYDDIRNSAERHTSREAGKQLLLNLLSADDVAATFVKLSLKCKLKKTRIEVPVRSVHCRPHLECVDLRNYLDCKAKNCATIDAPSSKKSTRPHYFAHILESVPANVDEVQLVPDGSFEEVSGSAPDVTIDDEEPFEPQQEHLTESSGPGHAVHELLKQSKAFQLTLQDGKTFRTKKDLLENVGSFLENQRDALGALLKKLTIANQASRLNANFLTSASRQMTAPEPPEARSSPEQNYSESNQPLGTRTSMMSDHEDLDGFAGTVVADLPSVSRKRKRTEKNLHTQTLEPSTPSAAHEGASRHLAKKLCWPGPVDFRAAIKFPEHIKPGKVVLVQRNDVLWPSQIRSASKGKVTYVFLPLTSKPRTYDTFQLKRILPFHEKIPVNAGRALKDAYAAALDIINGNASKRPPKANATQPEDAPTTSRAPSITLETAVMDMEFDDETAQELEQQMNTMFGDLRSDLNLICGSFEAKLDEILL